MLLSALELSVPTRFKALLSVLATAIMLIVGGTMNGPLSDRAADCSMEDSISERTIELPHSPEKEGESEKDAELEADTLSLFDASFKTDERRTHDRCASAKPATFLPLRSREVQRELFRPPQRG